MLTASALLWLTASCRPAPTRVELFVDTDVLDRAIELQILAFSGRIEARDIEARATAAPAGALVLQRDANGVGTFVPGGSIGIRLPQDPTVNEATLWVRALFRATASAPDVRVDRVARVQFVRGASNEATLFLSLACGDQSFGCTSAQGRDCTVSVRCREQNATCDETGACAAPELAVLVTARDGGLSEGGGVASRIDATTGRATDASSDAVADGPPTCAPSLMRCGGACVDTQSNADHCGACATVCPPAANGTAQCTAGRCTLRCEPGFLLLGGRCLSAALTPRQVAPISLGDTTLRRPTLRWSLPPELDGAVVELCTDRECRTVIETLRASGNSTQVTSALPARRVIFWRLRGRVGSDESTTNSATWLFHTPAVDASAAVDTSFRAHNDVNGDGFDDVVIGSPGATANARAGAGIARAYHGSAAGISQLIARQWNGAAGGDNFGLTISAIGDVNADGYGDVAIAAPHANPMGRQSAGSVSIFLGSAAGLGVLAARTLDGSAPSDAFGTTVTAGDFNGDGYSDVAIGAPFVDAMGMVDVGSVTIFHGGPMGITTPSMPLLLGSVPSATFGAALATVGDCNGDGFSDLAIAAPGASPMDRSAAGSVSIFHGAVGGISMAARVLDGVSANDRLGTSLSLAGDIDGDGYADLAVGADTSFLGVMRAGVVSVFHGSATGIRLMPGRVIGGTSGGQRFGETLCAAGDINGDGFGDLLVGAPRTPVNMRSGAGRLAIYHGSVAGIPMAPATVIDGSAALANLSAALASGDVNGDGFSDVSIGSARADVAGRSNCGSASVHLGNAMGLAASATTVIDGPTMGELLGSALALSGSPRSRRYHTAALRMSNAIRW